MSQITYDYIRDYLFSLEGEDKPFITELREYAINNNVPIIKFEMKGFLELFLTISKPKNILEIGTAIGYSSLLMSDILDHDVQITTIERNEKMIKIASNNFDKYGRKNIQLLEGDANDLLKNLDGGYDVIFMDAAKGQYMNFLPYCVKLLNEKGVLISDNVLQDGFIAKSRWSIPRRQRTIHRRMRQYLKELKTNSAFKTTILPIADGMAISYKI